MSLQFILSFFLVFCIPISATEQPKAKQGILDLSEWSFEENPLIKLDGEWEFSWEGNDNLIEAKKYMPIPSGWENFGYPVHGIATYNLKLILPPNVNIYEFKFFLPTISSAYQFFVNDCLSMQLGNIEKLTFQPYTKFEIAKILCTLPKNELVLKFKVANFTDLSSGLWDSIYFGKSDFIYKKYFKHRTTNVALFLAIFVIGIYHFLFYIIWKKEKASIYFGLFCFSVALRTISIEDRWILDIFDFLSFKIVHKFEMLGFYLSAFFLIQFLDEAFHTNKKIKFFFLTVYGLASTIVALLPFRIYIYTLFYIQIVTLLGLIYILYFLISLFKSETLGIRTFFVGISVFLFCALNDILIGMGLIRTPYLASFGLLFLVLTNAFVLLKKFINGYLIAEKLKYELEIHKLELEDTVKQRTLDYEKEKLKAIEEKNKLEEIMLKIFPKEVAEDLQIKGYSSPVFYKNVTIMFIDFVGFTKIVEKISPQQLINELSLYYVQFDKIIESFNLEKLKTIGDSYMCASGLPKPKIPKSGNYIVRQMLDALLAAFEILEFTNLLKLSNQTKKKLSWGARIGIHSGSLVAGVIGEKKFAYDVWGDTVNIASRLESYGEEGRVNVSEEIYECLKEFFEFEYRGEIEIKNKGKIPMYFVNGFKSEFSKIGNNKYPNKNFWKMYEEL